MGFYKKTLTLITIFLTITSHVATACFVNGSFSLINEIDSNGYVNIVNEILIPSECAESTIQINEDEVCGKISINPSKFNSWFYRR